MVKGQYIKTFFKVVLVASFFLIFVACSNAKTNVSTNDANEPAPSEETETDVATPGEEENESEDEGTVQSLELNPIAAPIRSEVQVRVENLEPNKEAKLVWSTVEGKYVIEDLYSFVGSSYDPVEVELTTFTADDEGVWEGTFVIPEDYGGDHDVIVYQDGKKMAQANLFVETTFSITPESGPLGSEITITGEGIGWRMYGALWHVNYNNNYMGMLTAVTTKGTLEAKIRAAGPTGMQTIRIENGASGFPFLNHNDSAVNYNKPYYFSFEITDEPPVERLAYVEDVPEAADGGIVMPELKFEQGVEINLNKDQGVVNEEVTMTGKGLPANTELDINWNTMRGSRVTSEGFWEEVILLDTVKTDENGEFRFDFPIPDDLGGPPHRIDIQAGDKIYGQAYLRILPEIVSVEPSSGPAGTQFKITIKGAGWTEYDNAYHATYDNGYSGYFCGFNSRGTIVLPLVASGEPGIHLIDIYPGIYKGQQLMPDMYIRPQLTYLEDHPGTGIPAMRTFFEVTK